ncbi:hypothetical protein [Nocardia sp. NPDC051750]|uniref:hypothetical protein n=1 Tax=Nocardia sp. NPDC051750 TaxID=3364325 RepID=UPI00378A0DBC
MCGSDGCGPWITPALLGPATLPGFYRCPDPHCLRAAAVVAGRISDHDHGRNVPGPCPWVGVRVAPGPPPCGCGPYITAGQLRIVCHHQGHPRGAVTAISCPGGCANLAPVRDGRIGAHDHCPWAGVAVRAIGLYPPLLTAPQ